MDFSDQPELKQLYDKCKYTVKLWEHNFKKRLGRLPSRLDIREADRYVRDAYRQYYQIKSDALEQSFRDVDGFYSDHEDHAVEEVSEKPPPAPPETEEPVKTWGEHLNKPVVIEKAEEIPKPEKEKVSKRIFCGARRSRIYSKKGSFSQSFQKNSDTSVQKKTETSIPEHAETSFLSENSKFKLDYPGFLIPEKTVRYINASLGENVVQSTCIIQSVLENPQRVLKAVDSGWLNRLSQLGDDDSEDIIDNSDDEVPPPKKPKLLQTPHNNTFSSPSVSCVIGRELEPKKPPDVPLSSTDKQNPKAALKATEKSDLIPEDPIFGIKDIPIIHHSTKNAKTKKNTRTTAKKVTKKSKVEKIKEESPNVTRQSIRSTRNRISMIELGSGDEDPFHSDTDERDPEYKLTDDSPKFSDLTGEESLHTVDTTKKKRAPRTRKSKSPEKAEIRENYELEYSIKPRIAAPRFENIKELISIENTPTVSSSEDKVKIKSKNQQDLEKLEKQIKSGNLNENYVTLNLRKKIYTRGKKNFNYSKYKKQQWINKKKALAGPDMDMGGCDGGMLTCFNCGGVGHFARNCQKTKGDSLLEIDVREEEPCPFPTLEEAAQMANDSFLAVRTPNVEGSSRGDIFADGESDLLVAEALKLEELEGYIDASKIVEPVYKTLDNGSVIETPTEVFAALDKFGYTSFRPGQETAVMRILSGKSTLVTLSTGSGKSLCYQLPAFLYSQRQKCISLVISPLVSLMEDQVIGIPKFLNAACLHTHQTDTQRKKILEALDSLNILLVSPEAIVAGEKSSKGGFGAILRKLPPIAFACIDEAHCVSQWSHNFRPSYLMICRVLRERMGVKIILGLTATATCSTADSIIQHLDVPDGRSGVISDVPLPDNLVLTVSRDHNRDQALLALISSPRFEKCNSIIIYCTRREECNRIATFLRTSLQGDKRPQTKRKRSRVDDNVETYHAGLPSSRRRTIQQAFMKGEFRIVVATVAFGMGINKADIRSVIHYNMPKSFESYVQEIGRAGRDGLTAYCHLFLDAKGNDENELRRHIYADSVDRYVIRKLLQKVFVKCFCKNVCPKHEVAFSIEDTVQELDIPEENISTLLCYLELHSKKYIELLSPAYTTCTVISYGGPLQIRKAAKECPPLAMALALNKKADDKDQNILKFPVVDIAAAIGWDSGICKHKLKNLEWITVDGRPKRSQVSVKFSELGFHVLAPGNLSDEELDEALDSIFAHVQAQEKTSLMQLRVVHKTLLKAAALNYKACLEITATNDTLKENIRDYFNSADPLKDTSIESEKIIDEDLIVRNVQSLISAYRDNNFTGRAVARIFHGVQSPNYPAVIWGRCKYWRCLLHVDFNTICKVATRQILNSRC